MTNTCNMATIVIILLGKQHKNVNVTRETKYVSVNNPFLNQSDYKLIYCNHLLTAIKVCYCFALLLL